jgi:preprotein translocase subunit SecF
MELIKPGTKIDFMGMRKYFYALSAFLFLGSIVAMFVPGPNWGTDFKGGTEVEVAFKSAVDAGKVRSVVEASGFAAPDVVAVQGKPNQYLIRVQEVSALSEDTKEKLKNEMCFSEAAQKDDVRCPAASRPNELKFSPGGDKISVRYDETPDRAKIAEQVSKVAAVKLRDGVASVVSINERDHKIEIYLKSKGDQILEGLHERLGKDVAPDNALRVEWIGPKAGAQLRDAAFKSVIITLFFIMAYIALRFDLRFAPGAILSLAHDVFIAIGAMCLTGKEITLSTIAAVLTVLGYSVTDTVVVYDRIRENLSKHRNMTFSEIVNLSVSEMFGRTIITSGTAALSMVSFLVFGTQVIKDFAFVMLIGIAVGTYSSIYVAAPFTEWVDRRFFAGKVQRAKPSRTRAQKQADAVV